MNLAKIAIGDGTVGSAATFEYLPTVCTLCFLALVENRQFSIIPRPLSYRRIHSLSVTILLFSSGSENSGYHLLVSFVDVATELHLSESIYVDMT